MQPIGGYAEVGTENVSLAYANRSLCFLKMDMYDKCLVDIDLAIRANYPKHQMAKLEERKAYCLKQINNTNANSSKKGVPILDFQADGNFPGMANVLQMECNEKFGRHFVAKTDIDPGKVVVVEESFVVMDKMQEDNNICSNCLKNSKNFIACANCTNSLFCDQRCAADDLHKIKCNNIFGKDDRFQVFVSRSVLRAIHTFEHVENLMEFVSNVVTENPKTKQAPTSIADMESKYRLFLQLNICLKEHEKNYVKHRGNEVFEALMKLPEIKTKFAAENQKRFLKHLCVMHASIVGCNSFQNIVTGGIFLLRNNFNHSCAPNTLTSLYENRSIAITSRRIKKGDQLFISYGARYFGLTSRQERQQRLYDDFGFWCECEKCKIENWPISSPRIRCDPNYQYLVQEVRPDAIGELKKDRSKCANVKKQFLDLLIRYSDSPWCIELDMASQLYEDLYNVVT